jgi:hypothetical protein
MPVLNIEVPEEICHCYQTIDVLKQTLCEDFVASEYQKAKISIRQGAKMLGLTYEEFMVDFLGNRQISVINGTPQELEMELQQENAWLDKALENRT